LAEFRRWYILHDKSRKQKSDIHVYTNQERKVTGPVLTLYRCNISVVALLDWLVSTLLSRSSDFVSENISPNVLVLTKNPKTNNKFTMHM
jgi:hypothetical protein